MLWVCTASLSNTKAHCLQVLDDSTCKVTRQLVDEKAAEWAERGIRCDVVRRTNRQGYKAGALKDVSPSPAGYLLALLRSARQTQSHVRAMGPWAMHAVRMAGLPALHWVPQGTRDLSVPLYHQGTGLCNWWLIADSASPHVQGLDLLSDYDYIAIFDADFKPDSDFLVSAQPCRCPACRGPPAHYQHHLHMSAMRAALLDTQALLDPRLARPHMLSMCAPASMAPLWYEALAEAAC